jgi:tryptophan-rich sensory protein
MPREQQREVIEVTQEHSQGEADTFAELPLKRQAVALATCLAIPFAAAAVGGYATSRSVDGWYQTLERPAWTPSGTLIGAVWTLLYALMGLSAWLTWRSSAKGNVSADQTKAAWSWFVIQLGLNTAWSFAFFGLRSPLGGLGVIALLWLSIIAWIRATSPISRAASWLQLPYLSWVSFAAFLNATIWWMNREA